MQANAKFDHVYAIVRLDAGVSNGEYPDRDLIMIKKIVRSQEDAEAEVARLSMLNADKGCIYYWQTTRLERLSVPESAEGSDVEAEGVLTRFA